MINKISPVKCLSCGTIVKGRSDKKFCNDYCRNEYNNALKATNTNLVRNINNALSKNRRVLEALLPVGQDTAKVSGEKLLANGFQFKYGTHSYTNKKNDCYYFCYDMGYLPLDNNWYLLVKQRDEY